ncbi:MAG: ABC transporter ATP-binding protein [Candidatus Kapaibacterium sp.]
MADTIIDVRGLAKSFKGFQAVRDVSFHVEKGDVFGFLGPNGAGKSTTLRCVLSLIRPDSGAIELFGMPLRTSREAVLARIGCIIERPDFYRYLSARRNLEIFGRISGARISKRDIDRVLDIVGLAGRGDHAVRGYSQGMKQRLGIALTLLHDPELIILDEPTNGLDPQGIIDIRNLVLRLRDDEGKTVMLSSHQLSEVELIASRMVIIDKGTTVVEGSVRDLLRADDITASFEVDDVSRTCALLTEHAADVSIVKHDAHHVRVSLDKNRVPDVTLMLLTNGIRVTSVDAKRRLEEYFISLLQS